MWITIFSSLSEVLGYIGYGVYATVPFFGLASCDGTHVVGALLACGHSMGQRLYKPIEATWLLFHSLSLALTGQCIYGCSLSPASVPVRTNKSTYIPSGTWQVTHFISWVLGLQGTNCKVRVMAQRSNGILWCQVQLSMNSLPNIVAHYLLSWQEAARSEGRFASFSTAGSCRIGAKIIKSSSHAAREITESS